MTLKEARSKNKLAEFVKEQSGKQPHGNRHAFKSTVKSMLSQKTKPKRGTSRKA